MSMQVNPSKIASESMALWPQTMDNCVSQGCTAKAIHGTLKTTVFDYTAVNCPTYAKMLCGYVL